MHVTDEKDPFAPTYEAPSEHDAIYDVDAIARGKRLQATFLLVGHERWIVTYRLEPERFRFIGKRVRVRGRKYHPSPLVQHVLATHFQIDEIELAPGETPWDPEPTELPPPPEAGDLPSLIARDHRWVRCVGELTSYRKAPGEELWANGVVTLADGEHVRLHAVYRDEAVALVGQRVVILATFGHEGEGEQRAWVLTGYELAAAA